MTNQHETNVMIITFKLHAKLFKQTFQRWLSSVVGVNEERQTVRDTYTDIFQIGVPSTPLVC